LNDPEPTRSALALFGAIQNTPLPVPNCRPAFVTFFIDMQLKNPDKSDALRDVTQVAGQDE